MKWFKNFIRWYGNRVLALEKELAHIDGQHKNVGNAHLGENEIPWEKVGVIRGPDIDPFCSLVQASEMFYQHSPINDYDINNNRLEFSSNVQDTINENKKASANFFKAKNSKNQAVIILPNWNSDGSGFDKVANLYAQAGITALRLTLPFHEHRRPSEWAYAKGLVSEDIGKTIASIRQAVLDTRCCIDWLEMNGYSDIRLIGISIGSCVATITAAYDPRVKKLVQILIASRFAEAVWGGIATEHLKTAFLQAGITLSDLNKHWQILNPIGYVGKLAKFKTEILMICGKYDPVFNVSLGIEIENSYYKYDVFYEAHYLPCGHYTLKYFPFGVYALLKGFFWVKTGVKKQVKND
jgi:pimeloyl-ACP methyl ester carboxylesterase